MSSPTANIAPPPWFDEAVERLLHGASLPEFCTWMAQQPNERAAPGADAAEQDWRRRAQLTMARWLWSHVPVPSNRWRPRPLPPPERNAPCYCGSGRKYKHCCQEFAHAVPPVDENEMLSVALSHADPALLEPESLRSLPAEALGNTAFGWNDRGEAARTVALLEPLFTHQLDRLSPRHELALDALMDALLRLHQDQRRMALAQHVSASGVLALATTARARLVTMLCDNGDYPGAWALLQTARRHAPQDPQLWPLEMTVLLSQGRHDEARLRGPLLAAQARKAGLPDLAQALMGLATEGLRSVHAPEHDVLDELPGATAWLAIARAVPADATPADWAKHGSADDLALGANPGKITGKRPRDAATVPVRELRPSKAMASLQRRWHRQCPLSKPDLTLLWSDDADALLQEPGNPALDFLRQHPDAWFSFDILDDLVLASSALRDRGLPDELLAASQRVLDHALAGLRALLGTGPCELPWLVMPNRPALRLLAQAIELAGDRHDDRARETLAAWGLALNPHDNHGWRQLLVPLWLEQSRFDEALALLERYPGDLPPSEHLRALALFALGRQPEAETVLRAAHAAYPLFMAALWPDVLDPPPESDGFTIPVGGVEAAHDHRVSTRAVWLRTGARDWARALNLPAPQPPSRPRKKAARPGPDRDIVIDMPNALDSLPTPVFGATQEKRLRQSFDYPRLHGLITAVAWSPEIVMPSRWVNVAMTAPRLAGTGDEIDSKTLQRELDTVMRLYNRINVDLLRTPPDQPPPLAALRKLLASEPDAVSAWAAGFVQGAELARGAWRGAHRPVKAGAGAFGVLLQLAAQAAPSPAGWRAESDQNQPLLVGLEPDAPSPQARLSGALADLWQVIGPLRHARLAR